MLMRVLLGWLRGERGHCGMLAIPTLDEEDARRPSRERENRTYGCVSSEGWHVQQETDLPGQ